MEVDCSELEAFRETVHTLESVITEIDVRYQQVRISSSLSFVS